MRISVPDSSIARASLALLFGAAVIGGATWWSRNRNATARQTHHDNTDHHRDQALQDSYPASDAPATRDYAIPVNAR
jgi:hypothetical protein